MRISTSMIYDTSVATMNRQQSDLVRTQQQVAQGKRVLNPSDDPVAAARALEVSQAASQVDSYVTNQGTAKDALTIFESKLSALSEIFIYAKERAIQAGNAALSAQDKRSIATDMRAQFDQLFSIANSTDANGEYVFAGFKGDTVPFTGSLLGGVSYQGDQGQRSLQVSSSRLMPVSASGQEVFLSIPNNNGQFNTRAGAANSGTAFISDGTVVGGYNGGQYGIRFTSATSYDVFDRAADPTMSGAPLSSGTYTDGVPIDLPPAPATAEIQVTISGAPSAGDTFQADPGGNTDVFTVLQQFIAALENPSSGSFANTISETIGRLDSSLDNMLRLRAQTGSRQVELEALATASSDLQLQYADRTNRLVGLDYASALSELQQQQTYLQASQQSFVKITGLSLFNFLS